MAQGQYYLKATYTGAEPGTLDMTDKAGNCWVISGGVLVAASPTGNKNATLTASYAAKLYSDSGCTAEVTGDDLVVALKSIGTKTLDIKATATGGVRINLTSATNYNVALLQSVKVGEVAINGTAGTMTVQSTVPSYISVSGNADNTTPSAGDAASEYTTGGTVVISLADQA